MYLNRKTPPHISTLIIITGVSTASINIFLPSLPGMAAYFNADYQLLQLTIALFLFANAIVQIFIGPVSDKFGRRPVILAGLFLFILATIGCIYAPNVTVLLAFRMAQAIVVTALVLGRAVVRDMVSTNEAASMIGYVTMGMSVVPMISPALGGILEEIWDWRASFWLLALLGLGALTISYLDIGETKSQSGNTLIEQFKEYPELLLSPRFWGYSLTAAFSSGAYFAYLGGAPLVGTENFGLSPTELGIYFGAPAIGYFAGNYISGAYSARYGVNQMVLWGCVVNAAGIAASFALFLAGFGSAFSFFAFMCFVGIGNGMVLPNATAGALSVRPHLAGTASGLSGAIMLSGGAGLSILAGTLHHPDRGAIQLLALMLTTGLLALTSTLYTLRREKRLSH